MLVPLPLERFNGKGERREKLVIKMGGGGLAEETVGISNAKKQRQLDKE
jgi:hypothetical protein